ncbi:MAG TPA: hydrogenase small subunit [Syntrophomonadaceae bacterium]|nr:hydrogenase small subunit [Syntrophomonadaceae bacterium]
MVNDSFYDIMRKKGYSRREFLKMCTILTAMVGLEASFIPRVAYALENKPRLPVIYLQLQECTCCGESFIRTAHPLLSDLLFNMISLDYMETLQAAAGFQAEEAKQKTMRDYRGNYLVVVEGSIPLKDNGIYCTIGGVSARDRLLEAAKDSVAVIAYGSCATNTCVQGAHPNPTGAAAVKDVVTNKPVIDVPGCPPIAEVIAGTIVHYITFDRIPELTRLGRPKAFYNHRIHDNCNRRAFFDAGMFVEEFDDIGAKHGWCLYKMGCKGPTTYNACAITQWNNGVSYPIKSGHPCIGCSEPNFYDHFPMYSHLAHIPGTAQPFDPDNLGKVVTGITLGGVAAHGVATGIIMRGGKEDSDEKGDN